MMNVPSALDNSLGFSRLVFCVFVECFVSVWVLQTRDVPPQPPPPPKIPTVM